LIELLATDLAADHTARQNNADIGGRGRPPPLLQGLLTALLVWQLLAIHQIQLFGAL